MLRGEQRIEPDAPPADERPTAWPRVLLIGSVAMLAPAIVPVTAAASGGTFAAGWAVAFAFALVVCVAAAVAGRLLPSLWWLFGLLAADVMAIGWLVRRRSAGGVLLAIAAGLLGAWLGARGRNRPMPSRSSIAMLGALALAGALAFGLVARVSPEEAALRGSNASSVLVVHSASEPDESDGWVTSPDPAKQVLVEFEDGTLGIQEVFMEGIDSWEPWFTLDRVPEECPGNFGLPSELRYDLTFFYRVCIPNTRTLMVGRAPRGSTSLGLEDINGEVATRPLPTHGGYVLSLDGSPSFDRVTFRDAGGRLLDARPDPWTYIDGLSETMYRVVEEHQLTKNVELSAWMFRPAEYEALCGNPAPDGRWVWVVHLTPPGIKPIMIVAGEEIRGAEASARTWLAPSVTRGGTLSCPGW